MGSEIIKDLIISSRVEVEKLVQIIRNFNTTSINDKFLANETEKLYTKTTTSFVTLNFTSTYC